MHQLGSWVPCKGVGHPQATGSCLGSGPGDVTNTLLGAQAWPKGSQGPRGSAWTPLNVGSDATLPSRTPGSQSEP